MSYLEVSDPKQIAALLHPLRTKILDRLGKGVATPSEVARDIGIAASKAHYHVRILEKAGLVKLVETRQVGSVTETYFAPVAETFEIRASRQEPGPDQDRVIQALFREIDSLLVDLRQVATAADSSARPSIFATVERFQVDDHGQATVDRTVERLQQRLADVQAKRPGQTYRLLVALVPMNKES